MVGPGLFLAFWWGSCFFDTFPVSILYSINDNDNIPKK